MTATDTTRPVHIVLRCRAFSCEGVRENRLRVKDDGEVRVYDSVAGHYTACHSLSASAIARAKRIAAKLRSGKCDESHECHYSVD